MPIGLMATAYRRKKLLEGLLDGSAASLAQIVKSGAEEEALKLSTAGPKKGESGATSSVASSWSADKRVCTRSPPKGRGGNDYTCTAAQTSVLTSLVQSSAVGHITQAMYTGPVHLLHHSGVLRSRCLSFPCCPLPICCQQAGRATDPECRGGTER